MDPYQKQEEAVPLENLEVSQDSPKTRSKDLEEVLELASAYKTIKRNCSSTSQGSGETLNFVLDKSLSRRLDNIVLIPRQSTLQSTPDRQNRASVIISTTPQSQRTSTPSNSPNPPPIPPKSCQSLIPLLPPRSRSCSPSCSDISSINCEVFTDSEIFDASKPTLETSALGDPFRVPTIKVTVSMDVAEEELYKKSNDLVYEMTDFDVQDINTETVADYKERLSMIKNVHKDLVTAIQNLLHD